MNTNDRLVRLLKERERLLAEKKEVLKSFREAIEQVDTRISLEVRDIESGQGNLFDEPDNEESE